MSTATLSSADPNVVWTSLRLRRWSSLLAYKYRLQHHDVQNFLYLRFRYALGHFRTGGASLQTLTLLHVRQKLLEWCSRDSEAFRRRFRLKCPAGSPSTRGFQEPLEKWDLVDEEDRVASLELREDVQVLLSRLSPLQRSLYHSIFERGLTVNKCCYALNVTPHVAYREYKALIDTAKSLLT